MDFWDGLTVVVTGATGTFGTAFSERLLRSCISKLIGLSRGEEGRDKFLARFQDSRVRHVIADVRDRDALMLAFDGADVVVHAAALKRVPGGEYCPEEFCKTNVDGARNVVFAARERNVRKVMALSTDKAVAAINVYGRTKALAESFFVAANAYTPHRPTRFSCVRYGNVMGSAGSVIPLFRSQAAAGGPLTITHPAMTRFWITLEAAADFVFDRVAEMSGGEIFVPELPAASIGDIAQAVAPGMGHRVIGARPGEKHHEVLIAFEESPRAALGHGFYVIRQDLGQPAGASFTYSSDTARRMSAEEIRRSL